MENITAWERLQIVHNSQRPNAYDYIEGVFKDYYELFGDRCFGDDKAITAGIAMFLDFPVTVIASLKGKNLELKFL